MRKLASIETIKSIKQMPGADLVECVGVLGWECVAKKKANSKKRDKCVYFEIDSLLPEEPHFEFLKKFLLPQRYQKVQTKNHTP
jgi:hypothetical protein